MLTGLPLHLITLPLLFIEGFFVPAHLGFLNDSIPLTLPYKKKILKMLFILELIPMLLIWILSEPLDLPGFTWMAVIHNIVHVTHAIIVVATNPPKLYQKPGNLAEGIIGRLYVVYDGAMHVSIAWRLGLVSHIYELVFVGAFWLCALYSVSHEYFLEEPIEKGLRAFSTLTENGLVITITGLSKPWPKEEAEAIFVTEKRESNKVLVTVIDGGIILTLKDVYRLSLEEGSKVRVINSNSDILEGIMFPTKVKIL